MRTSSGYTFCQLVLLLVLALTSALPTAHAQTTPPPSSSESGQPRLDAQPFDPEAAAGRIESAAVSEEVENEPPSTEALPEATPVALDEAAPSMAIESTTTQSNFQLDVSAPDMIRAGDAIIYTYTYRNDNASPVSGVEIQAVWSNFKKTQSSSAWQWCGPENCSFKPDSVKGPAVTTIAGPDDIEGMRFRIGELAPGQSGEFSIVLRSNSLIYPKTGQPITRPAGSAKLYYGSSTPLKEDTANTMVIGPVFNITKIAVSTAKIYPGETVEFIIRIGNATGSGDIVNGIVRADAIDATNVVVTDLVPAGGEFVSASIAPVDPQSTTLTWNLGTLKVKETKEIRVIFRKADVNIDCKRLNNATYKVSSVEIPSGLSIAGKAVQVDTVIPLVVKSVTPSPNSIVYGAEATLTIVVQNFYNKNLTGVRLNYDIQGNTYYIAGSATPAPTASPDSSQLGGRLSWTFDMPAGSKTTPTEKSFTLRVRADYTSSSNRGAAYAQIIPPAGVPSACIVASDYGVKVEPRLSVIKTTDASPDTKIGSTYIVERGSSFWYTIELRNNGPADAADVSVYDVLPREEGASFSYIGGSATLNGQPRPPDTLPEPGGTLGWNSLTIPAGTTVRLRYALSVGGYDFVTYCNYATAERAGETITHSSSQRKVCVKINPQIHVTKTANKTVVAPGEEVQFTLSLTNRENIVYNVGLYDLLGSFTFVRQVSGYGQPESVSGGLIWPRLDLQPGAQVSATIVVKAPETCVNKAYDNEVMFHNVTHIIEPIPRVKARVTVACDRLEFSNAVDRSPVSLQDRFVYTLSIKNTNTASSISNVTAIDVLPAGFSYVAMDASSAIKTAPAQTTRADGRLKLTWTIPSVAKSTTVAIKFIARSGNVVGTYDNWTTASAPGVVSICKGTCISRVENNTAVEYTVRQVSVQPLITIAPEVMPDTCATPGQTRTYRLSIVNTNNHAYNSTVVKATLPLGLRFVRSINSTPQPIVSETNNGVTTLEWKNLSIPAKPSNTFAAQVVLDVEIVVGQVWGSMATLESATSPDGLIPRKDGVQNVIVRTCPATPAIAKEIGRRLVQPGEVVLYQISLANTTAAPLTVVVEDQLPPGVSFREMVAGPSPNSNGSTLRWESVTVPAAANGQPGILNLQFRAQIPAAASAGTQFINTAKVTASSTPFNHTYQSVAATTIVQIFLSLIQR